MHTRARSCSAYTAMFIFVLRIALALLLIYASDEVSARDGTALGTKTVRPRANVTRDDTLPSSTALDEDVMARNLRAGEAINCVILLTRGGAMLAHPLRIGRVFAS